MIFIHIYIVDAWNTYAYQNFDKGGGRGEELWRDGVRGEWVSPKNFNWLIIVDLCINGRKGPFEVLFFKCNG